MFQISSASPTPAPATIRQIPTGNRGNGGFSLALDGHKPVATEPEQPPAPLPETGDADAAARHPVAATGKDLPEGEDKPADPNPDAEKDEDGAEAPFAWFGIAPAAPDSAPATLRFGLPAPAVALPDGEPGAAPQIELPAALPGAGGEGATPVTGDAFTLAPGAIGDIAADIQAIASKIDGIDMTRAARTETPVRIELPARELVAQSLAAMQPRTEIPPVVSAFANQLGGLIDIPAGFRSLTPNDPSLNPLSMTPGALEALRPNTVQSVTGPQLVAIDTTRAEWMTQTIERIEALRDSPNSRETSIRLSPDALGTVDVSIRQEGDRVHVRFTADNPAARALLAEAQPRLTEIAEARGLRLAQSSVDAGTAGQGQGQSQRQDAAGRPASASAPASAPGSGTGTNTDTNADHRVA